MIYLSFNYSLRQDVHAYLHSLIIVTKYFFKDFLFILLNMSFHLTCKLFAVTAAEEWDSQQKIILCICECQCIQLTCRRPRLYANLRNNKANRTLPDLHIRYNVWKQDRYGQQKWCCFSAVIYCWPYHKIKRKDAKVNIFRLISRNTTIRVILITYFISSDVLWIMYYVISMWTSLRTAKQWLATIRLRWIK